MTGITRLGWTTAVGVGTFATFALVGAAGATLPYTPVGGGGFGEPGPVLGPGLITPDKVFGKEYSADVDHEITAVGTAPDPKQIVAWDGIGGVLNGQDFSPPVFPTVLVDFEIDAIANHGDYLFNALIEDDAHLLFSLDEEFVAYGPGMIPGFGFIPPGAPSPAPPPVVLANGNMVGGSGEISYELATFGGANPADTQGRWADQAEINGMPLPRDIDGLEVWGPEPGTTADVDKLSLRLDAATGFGGAPVSVFNGDGTAYITLPEIEAVVTSLLGDIPTSVEPDALNLDALMVRDIVGEDTSFDRDPTGPGLGDAIIFSIDQIADPTDPDGYYATGSEIFVLDAGGFGSFLTHGGHAWDHAYALSTFSIGMPGGNQNYGVFDIDAIEAVSEFAVPEPTTATLLALLTCATRRRKH